MGYLRGLMHGAVIGTVVGLCVAPQDGRRTREQLLNAYATARGGVQTAQDTARRLAPTAQSAAQGVGEMVGMIRGRVERMRGGEEQMPATISVNGGGMGGSEG